MPIGGKKVPQRLKKDLKVGEKNRFYSLAPNGSKLLQTARNESKWLEMGLND